MWVLQDFWRSVYVSSNNKKNIKYFRLKIVSFTGVQNRKKTMADQRHRLLQDLMERNDGWPGGQANESALEYDYMTRHLTLSVLFLSWTSTAVVIGSVGNIFVSTMIKC